MTILLLIVFIFILSAMQSNKCDRVAGYLFSVPFMAVYLVGDYIPGAIYFHISGVVSLVSMIIILKIQSSMSYPLSIALFCSILINFLGFVMWFRYKPPTLYVISFSVFYAAAAYIVATRGTIDWSSSLEYPDLSCSLSSPGRR